MFFFLSDTYIEPYSPPQIVDGKMKIRQYLRKKHPNVFQNKLTKIFETQRILDLIKLVECFRQFDHHKIALLIYTILCLVVSLS